MDHYIQKSRLQKSSKSKRKKISANFVEKTQKIGKCIKFFQNKVLLMQKKNQQKYKTRLTCPNLSITWFVMFTWLENDVTSTGKTRTLTSVSKEGLRLSPISTINCKCQGENTHRSGINWLKCLIILETTQLHNGRTFLNVKYVKC